MSEKLKFLATMAAMFVSLNSIATPVKSSGLSAASGKVPAVAQKTPPQNAKKKASYAPLNLKDLSIDIQLLANDVLPFVQLNEAQSLCFYRSNDKVTVGYGSNVEANRYLLDDVAIYHNSKKLNPKEKKEFLDSMTLKTRDELSKYTISETDASRMACRFIKEVIPRIAEIMTDDKTNKTFFYDLPLCMQALCVDICYNTSEKKFAKYQKLKAALQRRDWDAAIQERTVYVDKVNKTTNKARERRKKYLLNVLQVVENNPKATIDQLRVLLERDYRTQTSENVRALYEKEELGAAKYLLIGEYTHRILLRRRADQNKKDLALQKQNRERAARSVGG